MKRLVSVLILLVMMTAQGVFAERALRFEAVPDVVRPGQSYRIAIDAPQAMTVDVAVADPDGNKLVTLLHQVALNKGINSFSWDGMQAGEPMAPGSYQLTVTAENAQLSVPVTVEKPMPRIVRYQLSSDTLTPGEDWSLELTIDQPGVLGASVKAKNIDNELFVQDVSAGTIAISWDGTVDGRALPAGDYTISLSLSDAEGGAGSPTAILIKVAADTRAPQNEQKETPEPSDADAAAEEPATAKPDAVAAEGGMRFAIPSQVVTDETKRGSSYWTLPMGDFNEENIWRVMMQPIIVLDGHEKDTYKIRSSPDSKDKSNIIGEITYAAQGVHVVTPDDNGWTEVEAYNSSYGPDCKSRRGWGKSDELIRGFVETKYLKTITPRDDYGILIDKLKQEMYVFKQGKLFSTLAISTGLPSSQQPWNETPSGEFLMISRTGGFYAGNLYCDMAMRINGGCLIHEVPYIENKTTGYKDYSSQEPKLGAKASHGCVRVQRKPNEDGLNMAWLWSNIKINTKVLIWDDMPGRFIPYPADDMPLYFNPKGGKYYHLDQNCPSIKKRFLPLPGAFPYQELGDEAHKKLKRCPTCNPPVERKVIEEQNRKSGF